MFEEGTNITLPTCCGNCLLRIQQAASIIHSAAITTGAAAFAIQTLQFQMLRSFKLLPSVKIQSPRIPFQLFHLAIIRPRRIGSQIEFSDEFVRRFVKDSYDVFPHPFRILDASVSRRIVAVVLRVWCDVCLFHHTSLEEPLIELSLRQTRSLDQFHCFWRCGIANGAVVWIVRAPCCKDGFRFRREEWT